MLEEPGRGAPPAHARPPPPGPAGLLPAQHKQPGAPGVPRAAPSPAAGTAERVSHRHGALGWTSKLRQSHPRPCAGTTPTETQPGFGHVQRLSGHAGTALTAQHSFPKSEFPLFPFVPLAPAPNSTDQHPCPASKPSQGLAGGKWGELSLRGHTKASAVNKFNTDICTALKVTVGNTGKSSRLMSLPDSREFNASSRLGFLSLDGGHRALEGSSGFEGHSGHREGNEAFVTCAPFKAPAARCIESNLSSPTRGWHRSALAVPKLPVKVARHTQRGLQPAETSAPAVLGL